VFGVGAFKDDVGFVARQSVLVVHRVHRRSP